MGSTPAVRQWCQQPFTNHQAAQKHPCTLLSATSAPPAKLPGELGECYIWCPAVAARSLTGMAVERGNKGRRRAAQQRGQGARERECGEAGRAKQRAQRCRPKVYQESMGGIGGGAFMGPAYWGGKGAGGHRAARCAGANAPAALGGGVRGCIRVWPGPWPPFSLSLQ